MQFTMFHLKPQIMWWIIKIWCLWSSSHTVLGQVFALLSARGWVFKLQNRLLHCVEITIWDAKWLRLKASGMMLWLSWKNHFPVIIAFYCFFAFSFMPSFCLFSCWNLNGKIILFSLFVFFQETIVEWIRCFRGLYLRRLQSIIVLIIFLSSIRFASCYNPIRMLLSKYQSNNVGRTLWCDST